MSKTKNSGKNRQLWVWDFTYWFNYDGNDENANTNQLIIDEVSRIKNILNDLCKKWSFQFERGSKCKRTHFQGRISLKEKRTKSSIGKLLPGWIITTTTDENKDNDNYVTKEFTRIAGPWKHDDPVIVIPRDLKKVTKLYPWQEDLKNLLLIDDDRLVDIVFDNEGNKGKSLFAKYMVFNHDAAEIPCVNDYKDLMQAANCIFEEKRPKIILIDMPRAINKEKQHQLFSAIETIKSGKAFDFRYKYKMTYIDPPRVVVFTNHLPDPDLLSKDRWVTWEIIDNQLITYIDPEQREYDDNIKKIINEHLDVDSSDDGIIDV